MSYYASKMGAGAIAHDGHVVDSMNVWTFLSALCCVCACVSTYWYLQVREKYLEKANAEYEKTMVSGLLTGVRR